MPTWKSPWFEDQVCSQPDDLLDPGTIAGESEQNHKSHTSQ